MNDVTPTGPRVIHLAAGQGTRLRPITDDRPKPLVELGGKSLLERNMVTLEQCGVTDQLAVTGYRADQIDALGIETVHNPVYDETDMVYSLFCAKDQFPEDRDLLISYGDIIYEERVVEAIRSCRAPICVVVDRDWQQLWEARFDDPLEDAETLRLDADDRITEIGNEPTGYDDIEAQYIGLIKIRADYVDRFVERYNELAAADDDEYAAVEMTHYLQSMIDDGWDVRAVPIDGGWLEVDTVAELEQYRDLYEKGELSTFVEIE